MEPIGEAVRLTCCCCGERCDGRQWYNRDTGFGLCPGCAERIAAEETPEEMYLRYGVRGVHYGAELQPAAA